MYCILQEDIPYADVLVKRISDKFLLSDLSGCALLIGCAFYLYE